MNRFTSVAAWACCAVFSSAGLAQDVDLCDLPARRVSAGVYGPRTIQVVYGVNTNFAIHGFFGNGGARRVADEVSLSPGPGAGGNIAINGAYFGTIQPVGDTNSNDLTVSLVFYDTFAGWTSGVFPGATLLGSLEFDLLDFNTPGYVTFFDAPIPPNGNAIVTIPDADALVVMEVFDIDTTVLHPRSVRRFAARPRESWWSVRATPVAGWTPTPTM